MSNMAKMMRRPISSAHPGGQYNRDDNDLFDLKSAMKSRQRDYDKIIDLCMTISTKKWKDLSAAVYLTVGLYNQSRLSGLADGLSAIHVLFNSYWENFFPGELSKRAKIIKFLDKEISKRLPKQEVSPSDRAVLSEILQSIDDMKELFAKKANQQMPVQLLRNRIQALLDKLPRLEDSTREKSQESVSDKIPTASETLSETLSETSETASDTKPVDSEPKKLERSISHFVKSVIRPISGGSPTGADISKSDAFFELKTIWGSRKRDYDKIIDLSMEILGKKSKNLMVASWLTFSLYQQRKLPGLADGLMAIEKLIETFWENLYPEKMKQKISCLGNINKLALLISRQEVSVGDELDVRHSLESIENISRMVQEKSSKTAPLSQISEKLKEKLIRIEEIKPKKLEPKPKSKPPKKEVSTPLSSDPAPSVSSASAPNDLELTSPAKAKGAILEALKYMQHQTPKDPFSYRVTRFIQWNQLVKTPSDAGKAPNKIKVKFLNGLVDKKDWKNLLLKSEESFPDFPFWLDLQRLTATALEELGDSYKKALEGVLKETAGLLSRLPDLPSICFKNKMGVADEKTLSWIDDQVSSFVQTPVSGGASPIPAGIDDEALKQSYEEAKKLMKKSDLAQALTLLSNGKQDASRRQRFQRRLYMANLCLQATKTLSAWSILEELDQEIVRFSLVDWEPELALEVWTKLYKCVKALMNQKEIADKGKFAQKSYDLLARISSIDPQTALALIEKKR